LPIVVRHQESSAAPAFLIPTSASKQIWNDREASSLVVTLLLRFRSRTKSSPAIEEVNPFSDFCKKKNRLMLSSNAIAIARLFGKRHTNIRWKAEKDIYTAGIQSLEFSFQILVKDSK
jgi:hypothetical protein